MNTNVEQKVAALGLVITLVLAAIAYQFYQDSFQYRVEQYEQHVTSEVGLLATEAGTRMNSLATINTALANYLASTDCEPCFYPRSVNHQNFMLSITERFPSIRTVFIMDENGIIVDDTRPRRPGVGVDVSDRYYFKAHLDNTSPDLLVTDPVVSRVDGNWTWVLSVPVRDANRELMAVAGVSLDERYLSDLVAPSQMTTTEVTALVFESSRLLGISRSEQDYMGKPLEGLPNQPESGNWSITRNHMLPWSEEPSVVWQYAVKDWPLVMVMSQSETSMNQGIQQTLAPIKYFLIGLVIMSALVSVLLFVFLKRQRLSALALDASREDLEEAEELAQVGHFMFDLQTEEVVWSKGLHHLMGYNFEDTIDYSRVNRDMHHPDDRERINKWLEDGAASGKERLPLNTYRVIKRDGSVITVQCTGRYQYSGSKPIKLFGIVHDISLPTEENQKLRRYVETSGNLFLTIDVNGRIIEANQRTCLTLGIRHAKIVGEDWVNRFVDKSYRTDVATLTERIFSGDSQHYSGEFETDMLTFDNGKRRVHWYHNVETDANGHPSEIVLFGADVTDQRAAETRARELAEFPMQNPNLVLRVNRDGLILISNPAVDRLLSEITQGRHPGSESVWQEVIEGVRRATRRHELEIDLVGRTYYLDIVPISDSNYVNVYGFDITEAKDIAHRLNLITNQMPGAVFEYIAHSDGTDSINFSSAGCKTLFEYEPEEINANPGLLWSIILPEHIETMQASIQESAKTMESWSLEWQVKLPSGVEKWVRGMGSPTRLTNGDISWNTLIFDITDEKQSFTALSEALKKTINVLSAAVEIRDPYTAGHESRVAGLAMQIGEKMGLDADQLEGLFLAASIHDVGKIQIPSDILSKPTRLSDIEYELVKRHSETGAALVSDIDFKWPIAEIILQHHERLDGSGYPRALSGDEILPEARILAVADVVEAMASHRPYRAALGLEAAANEIREGQGIRYDSEVVDAAISLIEEGVVDLDVR